jgi:hypothetical protein
LSVGFTTRTCWMMLPRGKPGGKLRIESFQPPPVTAAAAAALVDAVAGDDASLERRLLALERPAVVAGVIVPGVCAAELSALLAALVPTGEALATAAYCC